jgi:ADP-dependent NAD(P)H-hydrate dehydratase / NAD(P)H-hydrate epimerase
MIKILSTTQIRELDRYTIEHEPIASIDLMERACQAFVDWYVGRFQSSSTILIVCGTGNNGGDGLGIARLLSQRKFSVTVCIVDGDSKPSLDCTTNLKRLPAEVGQISFKREKELPESEILIDALFGSGLSRSLQGIYADAVSKINNSSAIKIAVDIPSGLFADANSRAPSVQADFTITFQLPKLSFLLPQNEKLVGEWHAVNIGLSQKFIQQTGTRHFLVDSESIKKLIKPRDKFSHKGDFGHALVIGGSYGKIGASVLATRAAIRAGSGLVTSLVPKCGYSILQSVVPEAMVLADDEEKILVHVPDIAAFTSIGIGPGLGRDPRTAAFLANLFSHEITPCVIDADALNILSDNRDIQNLISANSILTPHPGEFRRLVGNWKDDFERLEMQRSLSAKLKSIVVLKGAHTSISMPNGDIFFNSTGNPAMATAGSGDVLTGLLTALLAQGYKPADAALIGVFIHGLAGDLATKKRYSIIASDIIEEIPAAFGQVTSFSGLE